MRCNALLHLIIADTPFAEETLDPEKQSKGDTKEGFYFGRSALLPCSETPVCVCFWHTLLPPSEEL